MIHTLLRRNNAHSQILHMIAARAPGYVIDCRMQHAETIQTIPCDRESMASPLNASRAKTPSRERLCSPPFCTLSWPRVLPDLAWPDSDMFDDDDGNLLHTCPHIPDGLAPDGGHPRLYWETLPTTDIISYLLMNCPRAHRQRPPA